MGSSSGGEDVELVLQFLVEVIKVGAGVGITTTPELAGPFAGVVARVVGAVDGETEGDAEAVFDTAADAESGMLIDGESSGNAGSLVGASVTSGTSAFLCVVPPPRPRPRRAA